jgi:hypothetical protein
MTFMNFRKSQSYNDWAAGSNPRQSSQFGLTISGGTTRYLLRDVEWVEYGVSE